MEIFHGATEEELEVAEILTGLSQKILSPIININWSGKRKRSSPSSSLCISSFPNGGKFDPPPSTSSASPEPLSVAMPSPLWMTLRKASREEHQFCGFSRIAAETSDNVLKLSEQNPAKKMRREDTSQLLSAVSKQKEALVDGMEAAMKFYDQLKTYQSKWEKNEIFKCIQRKMEVVMRFYDQIKVNKLMLEEKEQNLRQCQQQEEELALKQHLEQEQNLKQRLEEEERQSNQNHTAIINANRQLRPLLDLDLNFPPLAY